ncbi:uncharacterized mitochondrial protein AtMg00810-like [Beta vulgaris subsp. vulgaris]|uniref:uncharacterized mitochondrial protein AtMg00810-like n=1 Tax=Beta vulgaris subsp. vulgaris TaxID=3555 RepID=UPI0020376511|nr:uncharacterized mitochondrial protein AtMg00810-like [Beta vulgaris subsp. vulgaris]
MDVKNAFLHGELQEHVYMKLPPGYQGLGHRLVVQSEGDYVKQLHNSKEDVMLVILVYVDDLIIASNSMNAIERTKALLSSHFQMKDLGILRYFLGIEVDHCNSGIFLSQKKYIQDLLKEYGMMNCKPVRLPMDSHTKLSSTLGDLLPCAEEYQKLVGKLIYLSLTRPDVTFTVNVLSRFMHKPTNVHMQAAKRVLRYLAGSMSQGILLANTSSAHLQAFCDSDWAGCASTRRSTSGFCILLGDSPISWKSKRQSVVARSSAEAEYRSMALTICEVMWLKQLFQDLGVTNMHKTPVFCDNQAALAIASNPVHHEKTKHVDIDCHFIRDKTNEGVVLPTYVSTKHQVVDVFTKLLSTHQHQSLLGKLGVQMPPHSQLEGVC